MNKLTLLLGIRVYRVFAIVLGIYLLSAISGCESQEKIDNHKIFNLTMNCFSNEHDKYTQSHNYYNPSSREAERIMNKCRDKAIQEVKRKREHEIYK